MSSLASKALPMAAFVLGLGIAIVDAPSSADPTDPPTDPGDTPPDDQLAEPITGDPIMPTPGDEAGPIDPFHVPQPEPGDVPLEDLSEEEQGYVLDGVDVTEWDAIHTAYSSATAEAATHAASQAAAEEQGLGGDGLGDVGVVP